MENVIWKIKNENASKSLPDHLFVRNSLHGVLIRRPHGRVERADHPRAESDQGRLQNPCPMKFESQGGRPFNPERRDQGHDDARDDPDQADRDGLFFDDADDVSFRSAERFQNAYLARALGDCRIHGQQYDERADDHRQSHDGSDEALKAGDLASEIQAYVARQHDLVLRQFGVYAARDLFGGDSVIHFDQYPKALVLLGQRALQRAERHLYPRSDLRRIYSGDFHFVAEDLNLAAHADIPTVRLELVNDHLVIGPERAPLNDPQLADRRVCVELDPVHHLEAESAVPALHVMRNGADHPHPGNLLQAVGVSDVERHGVRRRERPPTHAVELNLGPDPLLAPDAVVEQAARQPRVENDEDHAQGHAGRADQRASGALPDVR